MVRTLGFFADKDVRISGFVWEDMEKIFPGKAYLIVEPVGRGKVLMFADDPNFRLNWQSLNRLFLNSVLLSPVLNSCISNMRTRKSNDLNDSTVK